MVTHNYTPEKKDDGERPSKPDTSFLFVTVQTFWIAARHVCEVSEHIVDRVVCKKHVKLANFTALSLYHHCIFLTDGFDTFTKIVIEASL